MGHEASFAEILESKMRAKTSSSESKTQHREVYRETWSSLIGHFSPLKTAETAYAERLSTKAYQAFRPPPKVRPKHTFNAEQAIAFGFLKSVGASLEENFTKKELLKAFRSLALKLHPDQGGNPRDFQALLSARTALQSLF